MQFCGENGILTARLGGEILRIEPWGKDSLRVRATSIFKIYRSGLGAYRDTAKNVRQSLRSARRTTGLVTAPSIKKRSRPSLMDASRQW